MFYCHRLPLDGVDGEENFFFLMYFHTRDLEITGDFELDINIAVLF